MRKYENGLRSDLTMKFRKILKPQCNVDQVFAKVRDPVAWELILLRPVANGRVFSI